MFAITDEPIEHWLAQHPLHNPRAGAFVTFEGRVRNHQDGEAVTSLEYEIYTALAQSEGERILAETKTRFDILEIHAIHRHGHLHIGETAVWIGVLSPHRKEAFEACEYAINEIKHRLPIWKKEHYANGDSGWVNCERCAAPGAHAHA